MICNYSERLCRIIDFSCPADINISRKIDEKMNIYCPLLRNLQVLYLLCKFEIIPFVAGALGYVPKCSTQYLSQLGLSNIEIRKIIRRMQNISVSSKVKICKTYLKLNDS